MYKTFFIGSLLVGVCFSQEHRDSAAQGIDISHHQGRIDWKLVKTSTISFAFIKATEGGDHKDSLFNYNSVEARKNDIAVGAYHYFSLCRPAIDQVNNFTKTVPVVDGDLPPVIDVEFVGNCKYRPANKILHDELRYFIESVRKRYGVNPILYTTEDFYFRYKLHALENYYLWLRNFNNEPDSNEMIDWLIWQYKVDKMPGISGNVDCNVMRGKIDTLPKVKSGIYNK